MKTTGQLARLLCIVMMLAFVSVGWAQADPWTLPAPATLNVTVDEVPLVVNAYNVVYVANPIKVKSGSTYTYDFQSMNIYVPSNATEDSPIILQDNNGGWNGGKAGVSVTDGTSYSTASTNTTSQKTAAALKAGYVIANVGCRSRLTGAQDVDGNYIAHSPAQVVDVKAAIRYLRHNDAAMPGTTNRIVITGSSGGGALGVAIAASGNSPDYYPYLYELGAAGVTYDARRGAYRSTLNDDVFGTVLYCPITDLDHMDAAYEWMYGQTRRELGTYVAGGQVLTYTAAQWDASDWLAGNYATYFNGLGLTDKHGKRLIAHHFRHAIQAAAERGVEKAYRELGPAQMAADISALSYADSTWYTMSGSKATVELDKYLYFVAKNTALKGIPASDNLASPFPNPEPTHNESSLAGTTSQVYSNFAEWSWNNNAIPGDGVGYDDTGLPWRNFIHTQAGKAVVKQMVMSNPMPYLLSDCKGDSAPYWYFRHGMRDRDTSFDVPVSLYYAVLNASNVNNVNFNLAWLKPHSGDYDVPEAYEWVAETVNNAKYFDAIKAAIPGGYITGNFNLPTGDETNVITYRSSDAKVVKVINGQAVVTRPAKRDARVTLTAKIVSDEIAGNGYNYGKVDVTRAFTFTVSARHK